MLLLKTRRPDSTRTLRKSKKGPAQPGLFLPGRPDLLASNRGTWIRPATRNSVMPAKEGHP